MEMENHQIENLFFASSPEPKGQLSRNLVGSIGVTCRLKIDKKKNLIGGIGAN